MLELILLCLAPAAGGAALHKLWITRPARQRHSGLAVGQIPQALRRRAPMAVRRAGGAA
ncbi:MULTISPECIES: hypothetical protein [Stenotrophomonas]|uniref:hypothetical protein n=1 Tax=Stenotrophomonas TaxID=40323 RepID=UPI001661054A|nr:MULTISPECIES: hypothetical protein [Stenotrophomonas]MBN5058840.1 hypothetical protein [Stenotrophomonas maltophilia]MBN5067178.1 hypothetical protein [Stenotrophomonas maltophilia]MCW8342868.1 hypothetical protein [Stenotrophomonas sp. SG1]UGB19422.1 hypothetical protein LQ332_09630 [Stenotrophomonas maltophilia]UGB50343.1 hypothetical protein LQ330_04530 [Stenotrophomonas maltophilia]